MEKWTQLESPNYSDNEDTYDTETDNMCSDEPIDLKQVNYDPNQNHENTSNDWETSKLVKAKAFRIKDILGLEENDKFTTTANLDRNLTATTRNTSMFLYIQVIESVLSIHFESNC